MRVLAERGLSPSQPVVESHQDPVNRLLQLVESQELKRDPDGDLQRLRVLLVAQKPGQGFDDELPQPLPLRHRQSWKSGSVTLKPRRDPPIKLGRVRQGLWGALCHATLESRHVDLHPRGVQGDRRPVEAESRRFAPRQGSPKREQGLSKAGSRLDVRDLAPEEGCRMPRRCAGPGAGPDRPGAPRPSGSGRSRTGPGSSRASKPPRNVSISWGTGPPDNACPHGSTSPVRIATGPVRPDF